MVFILTLVFTLNFSTYTAFARGEAEFQLNIDSLRLQEGVSTNLVVSLVNAPNASVKEITGLENFDVLSTGQSSSTQIINGDLSMRKDIRYVIMPKQSGQFTLQARVEYNGQIYTTNELQVTVSESATSGEEVENLFIKAVLSEEDIFLGQKAVLTYELYSRYNLDNFGFLDDITLDGFIASDIPQDKLKAEYVYLNGYKYVKYEARQLILSPTKAGTYKIPACNFQANIITGDFFSSSRPVYLKTEPLELTVNPLPPAPAGYSGVVGKPDVDTAYSRQQLNYGDSLTLTITLSGNCNLDPLTRIYPGDIDGFAVYETQKNAESGVENYQYQARKEFEIILVPETAGDLEISPVTLTYFNPESGAYETTEIPGATITVLGQAPVAQAPVQTENAAPEIVRIEQVSYNTGKGDYLTIQLKKETVYIALLALGVLVLLAVTVVLLLVRRKRQNDAVNSLYRKIQKSGDRHEIYNLFSQMVKACFDVSLKANTRDAVSERLSGSGLGDAVLEIRDILEGRPSEADLREVKNRIRECCRKLKKHRN